MMKKSKEIILAITEIEIEVLKLCDSLSASELSDIKVKARKLYENLVWLQYEAESKKK